jgi:hypothetical protein
MTPSGAGTVTSTPATNNTGRVWGSWASYSVISGGRVIGMGSGAAYGYNGSIVETDFNNTVSGAARKSHLGGSWMGGDAIISTKNKQGGGLVGNLKNQCAFSKMTSSNMNCATSVNSSTGTVGNFATIGDKLVRTNAQISTLKSWFQPAVKSTSNGVNRSRRDNFDLNNAGCRPASLAQLSLGTGVILGSNNVAGKNDFYVICSAGTVNITADLIYDGYNLDANSTPQILIFANSISISANVGRVDAWLIADNIVRTCTENNATCGNRQLVINGPVFARDLQLTRRYHNMKQPGQGLEDKGCSRNVAVEISRYSTNVTGIRTTTRTWDYKVPGSPAVPAVAACSTCTPPTAGSPGSPLVPSRNLSSTSEQRNSNDGIARTRTRESTTFINDACDLAEPAEIFNLRVDSKMWAFSEMKQRSRQVQINGLREILPLW